MDCSTLYVIIKMTTNEAIAIAISDTDCMPYRYREASLELANAVLNLRQELEIARTEQKGKFAIQSGFKADSINANGDVFPEDVIKEAYKQWNDQQQNIATQQINDQQVVITDLKAELIGELRSELAIAAAYCANKTVEHCVARLKELEG